MCIAWAVFEVGSAAYDVYQTYQAYQRSPEEGKEALQYATIGAVAPGPGQGYKAAANAIGRGHAFVKHVLDGGEFAGLGVRTVKQFQNFLRGIMEGASTEVRALSRGRTAFWDDATGTIVIRDSRSADMGTAFRPKDGRAYFDRMK